MNLRQLKKMIAEEYSAYSEQVGAPGAPAAGGPKPPAGAPKVNVAPGDVDAGEGEDSEETLKQIYDMLKSYFEGGASDGDADMDVDMDDMDDADDADDDADDADDKDEDDDAEALQERFKKLANIIKG